MGSLTALTSGRASCTLRIGMETSAGTMALRAGDWCAASHATRGDLIVTRIAGCSSGAQHLAHDTLANSLRAIMQASTNDTAAARRASLALPNALERPAPGGSALKHLHADQGMRVLRGTEDLVVQLRALAPGHAGADFRAHQLGPQALRVQYQRPKQVCDSHLIVGHRSQVNMRFQCVALSCAVAFDVPSSCTVHSTATLAICRITQKDE